MDENFIKISISSDSGLHENNSHLSKFPSLCSSLTSDKTHEVTNGLEHKSFWHDDFNFSRFSTMARWQSETGNLNLHSNSSNQEIPSTTNDLFAKKNIPSTSFIDVLISPMSRLSTSSSLMSFNSLGNNKTSEQLLCRSTITNSTDQLIVPNENVNLLSSAASFLPLPGPLSHRQTLSTIDNIPLTITDNDLQRVPPSFILMQSPSTYANGSTIYSQPQPQPQIVHSTTRSNTMPSWRGYLPIKFE
ncbi:unnamed protein product, partial [Rotaria sordida]